MIPAALILVGTLLLLLLTGAVLRDIHRGALVTVTAVFLFLTYGYWVDALWNAHPDPRRRIFYHHAVLAVQAVALILMIVAAARRPIPEMRKMTGRLNRFGWVMLACPLAVILARVAMAGFRTRPPVATLPDKSLLMAELDPAAPRPDIYFIIMDAHGRNDVLRDQYGYDDSPFLNRLRNRGFYIADRSTSNYMWTVLSIPAALNMRYIDDLAGDDRAKWEQAAEMIHRNTLLAELRSLHYRVVSFEALEPWLSLDRADVYYAISNRIGFTPFQQLVYDTSALPQLVGPGLRSRLMLDQFHLKRRMMLYKMEIMPRVARLAGPKFVFLHLLEPHTPFVFAADGSDPGRRGYGSLVDGLNGDVTNQQYHDWYREQAIYVDGRVADMVDAILAHSAKPPIIVLMGDHGPRSGIKPDPSPTDLIECMSNLTAVYLPGKRAAGLYRSISPVNLFRVVLNDYFGTHLPMLEDRSYYSYPTRFQLKDVTAVVRPSSATDSASAHRTEQGSSRDQ